MSKKEHEVKVSEVKDDIVDTLADSWKNAIDEANRIQAQYAQAITNIQQEYVDACKKSIDAWASITKTLTNTTFGQVRVPAAVTKSISDTNDIANKINNISNKTILSSLELAKQNMRIYNDNIESFTKLSINFIKTWSSILTPQRS